MATSDPIADFLTRIRNANLALHRYVDVNWSKINESLAEILKQEGYIESFLVKKESEKRGVMRLFLKYSHSRRPVIQGIRRVSRPGLRNYFKSVQIPRFYGGMGLSILSTSQGVMAGKEAREKNIGGELLCQVW